MATTRNLFYYDPKIIDLDKLREEATLAAVGRFYLHPDPEDAIIHFHDSEEPCKGKKHEKYKARHLEEANSMVMVELSPEVFVAETEVK